MCQVWCKVLGTQTWMRLRATVTRGQSVLACDATQSDKMSGRNLGKWLREGSPAWESRAHSGLGRGSTYGTEGTGFLWISLSCFLSLLLSSIIEKLGRLQMWKLYIIRKTLPHLSISLNFYLLVRLCFAIFQNPYTNHFPSFSFPLFLSALLSFNFPIPGESWEYLGCFYFVHLAMEKPEHSLEFNFE